MIIKTLSDFSNIPLLTKRPIQKNKDKLTDHSLVFAKNQTGGSTGQPIQFYTDKQYQDWAEISRRWGFSLCGYKSGDRHVFVWGSDIDSRILH